jgi:hypothetical protein
LGNDFRLGWKTLAQYSKQSERALFRIKDELIGAKVIDYPLKGYPPRKVMRWSRERFDNFVDKNK